MGRRGPPPKPTAVNELRGNPGKRKKNKAEPKPQSGAPACPAWLDDEAQAEWQRIVPELEQLEVLTKVDRAALVNYCMAWSRLRQAQTVLVDEGLTFETDNGPRKRPEVGIVEKAQSLLKSSLEQFGLSPASRSRISTKKEEAVSEDPLDEFLK